MIAFLLFRSQVNKIGSYGITSADINYSYDICLFCKEMGSIVDEKPEALWTKSCHYSLQYISSSYQRLFSLRGKFRLIQKSNINPYCIFNFHKYRQLPCFCTTEIGSEVVWESTRPTPKLKNFTWGFRIYFAWLKFLIFAIQYSLFYVNITNKYHSFICIII